MGVGVGSLDTTSEQELAVAGAVPWIGVASEAGEMRSWKVQEAAMRQKCDSWMGHAWMCVLSSCWFGGGCCSFGS